ncbi:unnamed protein product, partial [Timema podura]|nr:unnamed protein product [Timema podura]
GPADKCKTPFARGFNQTEKNAIVNEHNRLRNIVALGKESRGNPGITTQCCQHEENGNSWNEELATIAQRWADQCKDGHDANRNTLDKTYVGQNIHYTYEGRSRSGKCLVVASFYNEVKEFNKSHVDRYV